MHDFYTYAENIFKLIARYIDGSMPEGHDWRIELLRQMAAEIKGIRPVVISSVTFEMLNEFRAFRHVFRNIYGFNLRPDKIERLLDIFPEVVKNLKKEICEFTLMMEEILESETDDG